MASIEFRFVWSKIMQGKEWKGIVSINGKNVSFFQTNYNNNGDLNYVIIDRSLLNLNIQFEWKMLCVIETFLFCYIFVWKLASQTYLYNTIEKKLPFYKKIFERSFPLQLNTTILHHFTETKAIIRLEYLYLACITSFIFDTDVDYNYTW